MVGFVTLHHRLAYEFCGPQPVRSSPERALGRRARFTVNLKKIVHVEVVGRCRGCARYATRDVAPVLGGDQKRHRSTTRDTREQSVLLRGITTPWPQPRVSSTWRVGSAMMAGSLWL